MKRFIRLLAFLLLFSMLCGLYGCTDNEGESESKSELESESESQTESNSEHELIETEDGLRVFAVGDIHYTSGRTNAYNSPYINLEAAHGYSSEERMQLFIDGILAEHEKKPVDAVLILGDIGNNDKPFQYFYTQYTVNCFYDPETDAFESGENRWDSWKDYMFDVFYQSEYDCIYQVKTQFLDQLTANGIPYYVASGNHDAYTDDMWRDCFGPKYDENGDLTEPSHIGDAGEMDYVIEFPEKDAALIILDSYSYDEQLDEAGNVALGPRYSYYMSHDTVAYASLEKDPDRVAWFEGVIEELQSYRHIYVGSHYYDGNDVVNGGSFSDWEYVKTAGNKYGNLRLMMYGHNQCTSEEWMDNVLVSCVAHFSISLADGDYEDPRTRELRRMFYSIYHSPWGYSVIESDKEHCEYYRIKVACRYEWDEANGYYLETAAMRQNPDLMGGDFDVLVPYKRSLDIEYGVWREYTLYPIEDQNEIPEDEW